MVRGLVVLAVALVTTPARAALETYQRYFTLAAAEFRVPVELLEAIAYVETRWQHLAPETMHADKAPAPFGVMGLRDGAHFRPTLREAAQLIRQNPALLKRDPYQNIRGAAALLARSRPASGELEAWEPAIAALSGIPERDIAQIHSHEVLAAIRDGRTGAAYRVQKRSVDLARAFGSARARELAQPIRALATDQPGVLWNPSASCNFSVGRASSATHVTIHTMQGSYAGSISWFKNCQANVSAHYLIRASDGQITQMVREQDTAFHVRSGNSYSVGIEHEGFLEDPARWFTDAMLESSAQLASGIMQRLGQPLRVYDGARGWNAKLARADFNVIGHVNYPNNTHTDPGAAWDWPRYRWLAQGAPLAGHAFDALDLPGRTLVFAHGGGGDLQMSNGAAFVSLGGSLTSRPVAGVNADGRVEVFARGADGALVHRWEKSPGGVWGDWHSLGGVLVGEPAIARLADGRLAAFVRGSDDALWSRVQIVPNGSWQPWQSHGGALGGTPVVAPGATEAFARGADGTLQRLASTGWQSLGGILTADPTVARNADGRLEIFARSREGVLQQIWERAPGGLWSPWWTHGGEITSGVCVINHADGRLEAFARAGDGALYATAQSAPNGGWTAWVRIAGFVGAAPDAIVRPSGEVELYFLGVDNALYRMTRPGGGPVRLGGPFTPG